MTFVSTKWIADQFIGFREVMDDVDDDLKSKCILGVWEGSRQWATMGSHTLYKYIIRREPWEALAIGWSLAI